MFLTDFFDVYSALRKYTLLWYIFFSLKSSLLHEEGKYLAITKSHLTQGFPLFTFKKDTDIL